MKTFSDPEIWKETSEYHQDIESSNRRLLSLAAGRNKKDIPDTDVYWLAAKAHMKQFHYFDDKF